MENLTIISASNNNNDFTLTIIIPRKIIITYYC